MKQGTGKTALVTGAGSGIGQELAKLFAQDGFNLVLVDHNEEPLHRLAEVFESNYGTETVTVINKDLAREDVAIELYEEVKAKGITVNILVNNAGISTYGKFATETNWEREKEVVHLNVLTTTLLTKLFLNDMVARNEGRILQLASMVSITPFPLMAVYAATKAYVWSLTQSLRNELKDTNVTVTALMPNATATNFFREADAPKLNVEGMLDDPAMVARDGYKALMKGEAKVVPGGLANKAQEVMAYLSPQEALAGMMRWLLTPKHESDRSDDKTPNWAIGLGVVAAAVAGYALVSAYNNLGPVDKMRYRYKAKSLGNSANNALSSVADSVLGAYHNGKAKVEEALA
ncbi:SDR family NAD(P)-dependent oxidoreductase [Spirosoma montaniterrae]|uniref:Short-chain dehydrogenase n=1 Tax=Spirosoma montaniterrae TaxID=1178516 RepID=A0A1P9X3X1_9BACT|nr:SDR family NAD(P)-dependent oxidoreductase [Spirosoma montaniterrae]AQG82344.1 short-chain dehydrogenase [Spirosoma montaniterrae]